MKLFKVWQNANNGYDTYDSMVVVASCLKDAKETLPGEFSGKWINGKLYY